MSVTPMQTVFFDLGNTLVRSVSGQSRTEWLDGAKQSIAVLSGRNVRLGLISNTGDLSRQQLFDELLPTDFPTDRFEEKLIVLSSEVGVEKPELQIFARAVDQAELLPGSCLFLTEEMPHVLAAQQMGLRALCTKSIGVENVVRDLIEKDLISSR